MVAQRLTEEKAIEAFNEAAGRAWEGYAYEKGRENIPKSDPIPVLVKDGAMASRRLRNDATGVGHRLECAAR